MSELKVLTPHDLEANSYILQTIEVLRSTTLAEVQYLAKANSVGFEIIVEMVGTPASLLLGKENDVDNSELYQKWATIREETYTNANISLVDWYMETYRKLRMVCGTRIMFEHVLDTLVDSICLGGLASGIDSSDLGQRINPENKQHLMDNDWCLVLLCVYLIDFDDLTERSAS